MTPERIFAGTLILFVLAWPLDRRHLFFTEHSFITGAYTEAGTLALYASDLAFLLLWAAWCWYTTRKPRETVSPRGVLWAGLAFVGWAAFRALPLGVPIGTELAFLLSWHAASRIGQGFLLALIAAHAWNVPRLRNVILGTLVLAGFLQSILGIGQVLRGRDFGLRFLGEHPLSLQTPGVAKVDFITQNYQSSNVPIGTDTMGTQLTGDVPKGTSASAVLEKGVPLGTKVLRAYGTFPHPNVLASFLLASIAGSFLLYWNRGTLETFKNLILVPIGTISAGLVMTFSRTGWISFLLVLGTVWICSYRNLGSYRNMSKEIGKLLAVVALGVLPPLLVPTVRSAVVSRLVPGASDQFIEGRISSFHDTFSLFARNPVLGIGTGMGFVEIVRNARNIDYIEKYVTLSNRESWQYQYPHSVPLVILLELGTVGLVLFLVFLVAAARGVFERVRNSSASERSVLFAVTVLVFIAVAVLALTDHYLWTIQQGRILLWGGIGVLASLSFQDRETRN